MKVESSLPKGDLVAHPLGSISSLSWPFSKEPIKDGSSICEFQKQALEACVPTGLDAGDRTAQPEQVSGKCLLIDHCLKEQGAGTATAPVPARFNTSMLR